MVSARTAEQRQYLEKPGLEALIAILREQGYTVLGPTLVDGVVSQRPIESAQQLARGIGDDQNAGHYRLAEGDPELFFQHGLGPDGAKRAFFPPVQTLFSLHVDGIRFVLDEGPPEAPKLAFLGIRPCELAAIAILDRVFGTHDPGKFRCESNPYYSQARQAAMFIAVNCTKPSGTCFCDSMGTGPVAESGFDLALTELRAGFVVEVGSPRGAELVGRLPVRPASSAELELAELRLEQSRTQMGRQLETNGLAEALQRGIESPVWAEISKNCLACGNCTMVCPTCFCASIVDSNDLPGKVATRSRRWESCFTHQFSYTTAGPVRSTIRARHRHHLMHKLSTWDEQFGVKGCVGCGRCITWCPVGLDITAEAARVRKDQMVEPAPEEKTPIPAPPISLRSGDGLRIREVTR